MKNNKLIILISILLTTSVFTFTISSVIAEGYIVYVDDDAPPGWYDETHVRTIQEGIDVASDGDTVFVYPGTYYGLIIINKTLKLTGEEKTMTIIDGQQLGDDTITVNAPNFYISGFTIRNSPRGSGYNSGLRLENADDSIIEDNIFTDNCWAAEIRNSNNCNFIDNFVIDNEQGGVHIAMSPSTQVTGCTFTGNGKKGLAVFKGNDHLISSNTFIDCGVEINSQPSPGDTVHCIMKDNTVNGKPLVYLENENGRIIRDAGQVILNQCTGIIIRNLNLSNTATGIRVYKSGLIFILGNTITNNFHGIGVGNSFFVNIRNNEISRNWYNGVGFSGNILCRLSFNEITENYIGLYLHGSTLTMPYLNRIHTNWNCNYFVSSLFIPFSFQIF
jgi:parallel beta-helix repeat protein